MKAWQWNLLTNRNEPVCDFTPTFRSSSQSGTKINEAEIRSILITDRYIFFSKKGKLMKSEEDDVREIVKTFRKHKHERMKEISYGQSR